MELPELPLVFGAQSRLGGRQRAYMVAKRKVAKDNPDLIAISLTNLLESRTDTRAVRSLEIHVFGDRDPSGRRTSHGVVGRDDNIDARRLQRNADVGVLLELVEQALVRLVHVL